MKRNISKVLAIIMALALAMSLAAVTAFAMDGTTSNTFQKYLVVGEDNEILPDVTFTFTVTAPDSLAVAGTADTLEIVPGPMNPAPTITTAAFTSASVLKNGLPTDADHDNPTAGNRYTEQNVEVDFSGVTFPAPGVYRYVITEEASTAYKGVTNDTNPTRYLDVVVIKDTNDDDSDGDTEELLIDSYVMRDQPENIDRNGDYVADPTVPGAKSSSYTNTYDTVDLEFSKKITGNQGDKNKQFKFKLAITDANPGQYKVKVNRADVVKTDSNATATATENEYTITVASDGTCTAFFYLADGDTVKVLDLPEGYGYTLTEEAEDYDSTPGVDNDGTDNDYNDDTTDSDVTADVKTGFTNDRNGIIPTGVIITVAPFAIGILVFGAIMLYMISKRRRAEY